VVVREGRHRQGAPQGLRTPLQDPSQGTRWHGGEGGSPGRLDPVPAPPHAYLSPPPSRGRGQCRRPGLPDGRRPAIIGAQLAQGSWASPTVDGQRAVGVAARPTHMAGPPQALEHDRCRASDLPWRRTTILCRREDEWEGEGGR
jgi:hypothetical protein